MARMTKEWVDSLPPLDLDDLKWADWASRDPGVAEKYGGNIVVCRGGEIIAFGTELDAVRAEAVAKTGLSPHQIILTGVAGPGQRDFPW